MSRAASDAIAVVARPASQRSSRHSERSAFVPKPMRDGSSGMAPRTILLGLGLAAALVAGVALGDDLTSRALLERQQQSDAFARQLQQSLESARAGNLGPRERLELDARQLDQRQRQDELFYRQQVQTNSPDTGALRDAEAMRADQERQQQLSRFRSDAAPTLGGEPPALAPAPLIDPALVTAPIQRAPADPAVVAAPPGAYPAPPAALAMIRRVEDEADTLWQAALAGDWGAVQGALGDVRRSVSALRSDRFKAEYAESGGRVDALSAVLDRLDTAISGAETQLGARDAASVMRSANELMLTAAELVPDISRPDAGQAASAVANRR
jgi:hypothetical protein